MTAASTNSQTITAALAAITGAEHVRTVAGATAVAPANDGEVAAILRFAQENRFAVVPWGGGTKQGWGYPVATTLVLEMHRLHTIREHTWQDMTCTVEAGCTIKQLRDTLSQLGQRLALDPLWPSRATVGGVLSTNDSGALRLRFGSLRDLIIGVTLALPDGTLAKSGGKVVKNVAGYDLSKLVTGALGTLGVITRATFRIHPMPKESRTISCLARDAREAQRLVLAIQDSKLHADRPRRRSGRFGALRHSNPLTGLERRG